MQAQNAKDIPGPGKQPGPTDLAPNVGNILFLTLIFYLGFVSRLLLGPMLPIVETELGIGHAEAGSVFIYLSAGYCLALLCSGFMASWLDHRRTIVISALGVGLGMALISVTGTLNGIRLGLSVTGLATGLYIPSGIAAITSLVDQRHWGKAVAIHEIAPNLSFTTSPPHRRGSFVLFALARGAVGGRADLGPGRVGFLFLGQGRRLQGPAPVLAGDKGLGHHRQLLDSGRSADFWPWAADWASSPCCPSTW